MFQNPNHAGNLDDYIQQILNTGLTQTQLEIATQEESINNILLHVPHLWRRVFMSTVKEQGIEGMLAASDVGEQMNDILENKAVVQFVQILLILFFTMSSSSEAGEEEDWS